MLRSMPCGVLLISQILAILIYPFLDDLSAGRLVVNLIGLVFVAMAVYAVRDTPALNWVSLLLGIPIFILTIAELRWPDPTMIGVTSLLQSAFYFYTAYALVRYMFADDTVTPDEVMATGATFTVLAWAFAYAFQALQVVWPNSFSANSNAELPRTWLELLFLSVTALTSTGLSDVLPIRPQARALIMIEMIAGMLYIALVVARVTALMVRKSRARHPPGTDVEKSGD